MTKCMTKWCKLTDDLLHILWRSDRTKQANIWQILITTSWRYQHVELSTGLISLILFENWESYWRHSFLQFMQSVFMWILLKAHLFVCLCGLCGDNTLIHHPVHLPFRQVGCVWWSVQSSVPGTALSRTSTWVKCTEGKPSASGHDCLQK